MGKGFDFEKDGKLLLVLKQAELVEEGFGYGNVYDKSKLFSQSETVNKISGSQMKCARTLG